MGVGVRTTKLVAYLKPGVEHFNSVISIINTQNTNWSSHQFLGKSHQTSGHLQVHNISYYIKAIFMDTALPILVAQFQILPHVFIHRLRSWEKTVSPKVSGCNRCDCGEYWLQTSELILQTTDALTASDTHPDRTALHKHPTTYMHRIHMPTYSIKTRWKNCVLYSN